MNDIYCLIMAGGSGTRFWPRSRTIKPKQYLNLFGEDSRLESTISRFEKSIETDNVYIVSGKSQAGVLEEQAKRLPHKNLIYEPVGRNTLPCIGLAAMIVAKDNPEGLMVVSPSDHLIQDDEIFSETVLAAAKLAKEKDGIVTIGITPAHPATGYGYVQVDHELSSDEQIRQFKVKQFVEKPDYKTASSYLHQGGFYWNSGLFIFKVSVFIDAVKKFAPILYKDLQTIQAEIGKISYESTLESIYPMVESISIDYGIMEHADNIYLVEGNFQWNDLGSWDSVYNYSTKDEEGNAGIGENIFVNTNNSYASTDEGIVAIIGLDDVVVVREGNAVMVCKRDQAEDVKVVVERLKQLNKGNFL